MTGNVPKGWLSSASLEFLERGLLLAMGSIAFGIWGLMLLRVFSDLNPLFELAAHTSLHAFVGCLLLVVAEIALFFGRRRSAYAGPRWRRRLIFTLIPLVFFGWVTMPWRLLPLLSPRSAQGSLKILAWNILLVNRHSEDVVDLVRREQPDIIALIEVSPIAAKQLEVLKSDYPYGLWMPEWQASGMVMLSRLPEVSFRSIYPDNKWMPALELELNRGAASGKLSILAVHTLSPSAGDPNRTHIRDAQLKDLGLWAREKDHAAMIVGDFNISPWSPPFWRLLEDGKLLDSSWYRGYFSSWPSHLGRWGIPIDHALVNRKIEVLDRRNLYNESHSDHCPVLISIQ